MKPAGQNNVVTHLWGSEIRHHGYEFGFAIISSNVDSEVFVNSLSLSFHMYKVDKVTYFR